jgi:hypothetical protein
MKKVAEGSLLGAGSCVENALILLKRVEEVEKVEEGWKSWTWLKCWRRLELNYSTPLNLLNPLNSSRIYETLRLFLINLNSPRCINLKIITMYTFSFERLEVWNKSRLLTKRTYKVTQNFPDSEKFGIVSQLRRSVISICSNIAEGSSRRSKKDQAHFYNIAYSI